MEITSPFRIYPCGDQALTIELGPGISNELNAKVQSLFHHLRRQNISGIRDIIPSYHTLTIVYDAVSVNTSAAISAYEYMQNLLMKQVNECRIDEIISRKIEIPVCYDLSFGLDLELIAKQHGITADEVISIHTTRSYRVYLIGFLPGFAYMGSVDARIATPRKNSPRTVVAAGSVGIAGEQTGIYPFDSPGGWQVMGRTPLQMFKANREQASLLQPGDEVSFYPISKDEFNSLFHEHSHK